MYKKALVYGLVGTKTHGRNAMIKEIFPDDRVLAFDSLLYENDVKTPLSHTMRPAKVVARYGYKAKGIIWCDDSPVIYSDLVDVIFDHRPELVSHAHFTESVKLLETE